MADPASLADHAGELADQAGALARNLDLLAHQLITVQTTPAVVGGPSFVYELTSETEQLFPKAYGSCCANSCIYSTSTCRLMKWKLCCA